MTDSQMTYISTFLSNLSVALIASGMLAILVLGVAGQFNDEVKGKMRGFVAMLWVLATFTFIVGLTTA